MKLLKEMSQKDLKIIKLIVLDVDGVLVPRGTEIQQKGNFLKIKTKKIPKKEIELIKELYANGFHININSGRGLYMLQKMFFSILPFVSLTYENGSATWIKGRVYQHTNSFAELREVEEKLRKIKSKSIKGFEPKEFIISIHCKRRIRSIEKVVAEYKQLYYLWNGEAYDIGLKSKQTKVVGLKNLIKILRIKNKNTLALGDNYNDKDMINAAGVSISADKKRLKADFFMPLSKKELPAQKLLSKILGIIK